MPTQRRTPHACAPLPPPLDRSWPPPPLVFHLLSHPPVSLSLSLSFSLILSLSLARSLARSFSLALAISLRSLTPRYRGCRDPDSPIYYRSTATKNAKVRKAQRQWRFLLEKAAEKEAADPTFRGCYFTEGRGEPAPPPSVANARENAPLRGPSAATSRRSCARHCRWKAATCSWFCERSVSCCESGWRRKWKWLEKEHGRWSCGWLAMALFPLFHNSPVHPCLSIPITGRSG